MADTDYDFDCGGGSNMAQRQAGRVGREMILALESDPNIQNIMKEHSMISGAVGLIPIPAAAIVVTMGNVYSMYYRINTALGISFSKNVVKSVAGMIASNLGQAAILAVGLEVVKFIPFIGSCVGGVGQAIVLGAATAVQGKLYCEWLRLMSEIDGIKPDGTIDESASASAVGTIFKDKSRIDAMMQEEKAKAKNTDYSKYKKQAQDVVNQYKSGNV